MPDDPAPGRQKKSRGDAPGEQRPGGGKSSKSQAGRQRSRAEEVASRGRSRKGRLTTRPAEPEPAAESFDPEDINAPPPDDSAFDDGAFDDGRTFGAPVERRSALPPSVERWRQRSGAGQVLTAVALGLQRVFERERDNRPAIVQEAPGDPYSDDDPVVVDFEPEDVDNTTVKVRPWLFDRHGRPVDPDDLDPEALAALEPVLDTETELAPETETDSRAAEERRGRDLVSGDDEHPGVTNLFNGGSHDRDPHDTTESKDT